MPKISDLCTAIVDSAFTLFPVDTERYELRIAVRKVMGQEMSFIQSYHHENWRINSWLREVDAHLKAYLHSYLTWQADGYNCPFEHVDNAHAVMRVLNRWYLEDSDTMPTQGVWVYMLLWEAIELTWELEEDELACFLKKTGRKST